jgi:AhpC/TSA antioxidant enzyme
MKRDWLPELAVTNTALAAVGMRDMAKAKDFVQRLDFPAEMLYVDENMKAYEALGMRQNMYRPQYLVELAKLTVQTGAKGDLKAVFDSGYKPYTPSGMPEVLAQVRNVILTHKPLCFLISVYRTLQQCACCIRGDASNLICNRSAMLDHVSSSHSLYNVLMPCYTLFRVVY